MKLIKKDLSFPFFTLLLNVITLCMSLFFFFYASDYQNPNDLLRKLGAPDAYYIYSGEYWGILVNTFTHLNPIMLIFNLVGLWILGAFFERRTGWFGLFLIGSYASVITSVIQLNLSNDPGIGMSGVNFFFLGLLIVYSKRFAEFQFNLRYVASATAIIGIGLIMYSNRYLNTNIGLEAVLGGFIFGIIYGLLRGRKFKIAFGVSSIVFSLFTLFYAPWSSIWNLQRGATAHQNNELKKATNYYETALSIDPDLVDAQYNLKLIQIDELSDEAFALHEKGEFRKAEALYKQILAIDPQNIWAKQQLRKLP